MQQGAVIGLVLAGGTGARLGGVTKATLRVGGERLLDRVVGSIRETASPILVSIGNIDPFRFDATRGIQLVGDLPYPGAGPAGGLAGAVAYARDELPEPEFLLSVAVDTPHFPKDFVQRAMQALSTDCAAVVAGYKGQVYPTNALWRLRELDSLPADVANGATRAGLKGLLTRLGAWRLLDYAEADDNPFANVNTLSDLLALNRRAAAKPDAGRALTN